MGLINWMCDRVGNWVVGDLSIDLEMSQAELDRYLFNRDGREESGGGGSWAESALRPWNEEQLTYVAEIEAELHRDVVPMSPALLAEQVYAAVRLAA